MTTQRAVFIWPMDKTEPIDIDLIKEHVAVLTTCSGWEIKILGNPEIEQDPQLGQYYMGEPTIQNLREIFDHSWDSNCNHPLHGYMTCPINNPYSKGWVIIYDHSWDVEGDIKFKFNGSDANYFLNHDSLKRWFQVECNPQEMCVIIMGRRSGRALLNIHTAKADWITITSMHEAENVDDTFNLARSLAEQNCAFDWRSAFLHQKEDLEGIQTPQILPAEPE